MTESAIERLKRLAAEKNAAKSVQPTQEVQAPKEEVKRDAEGTSDKVAEPEVPALIEPAPVSVPTSTHPLAMEMMELREALEKNVPGFANKLREIHVKLRNDPATVTLLSDEEIGVIVAGLEKHTNVQIIAPTAIKAAKSSRKTPVSASDL